MPSLSHDLHDRIAISLEILRRAADEDTSVVFANSLGAEDMVLTDLIYKQVPEIKDLMLDTGRLPAETYELLENVRDHYGRTPSIYCPDAAALEAYVAEFGPNAFYKSVELRKRCCAIRKIGPLQRALHGYRAWVTGLRREQSVTRQGLTEREWDEGNGLFKINPLVDWSETEIWTYLHAFGVPYNKLHDRHYPSIGCAPCTRAITEGEDVRAGRWWWELPQSKECGLHLHIPSGAGV